MDKGAIPESLEPPVASSLYRAVRNERRFILRSEAPLDDVPERELPAKNIILLQTR